MTEKEMHFWVAVKWFLQKELLSSSNWDNARVIRWNKRAQDFRDKNFVNDCAYCEQYYREGCWTGCPLDEAGKNCFKIESWYNTGNAEAIYSFAKTKYKECK